MIWRDDLCEEARWGALASRNEQIERKIFVPAQQCVHFISRYVITLILGMLNATAPGDTVTSSLECRSVIMLLDILAPDC